MGPFELVHKKLYADKTDADCTQLFMQSRVYSDEIMEAEKKGLIPHEDCFYERVKRTYHDVGIEMSREDADIFEQLYRSFQKKNMKNAKKVNCGKNKTSLVIKKLKKNRKYYVQIRTKSGKKYSAWSKVKTISKR